jgi:nitroreductase
MDDTRESSPAAVLDDLLRTRFSCRAYRPDAVPRAVIEAALATALRTPSWCNTQPWQIDILSGAALQAFTTDLYAALAADVPATADFPFPAAYVGAYRERRKVCGVQLYQALGIGRDDRTRAREQSLENYRCFGAPHAAIVTSDASLGFYGGVDCGLFLMSFLLALQAHGVDSVPQAALASHPDIVRRHIPIADDRRVVFGVSFGYGDHAQPVNGYRTDRVGLGEAVRFLE